jgi:hypothetical protein
MKCKDTNYKSVAKSFELIAFSLILTSMLTACCSESEYEYLYEETNTYNSRAMTLSYQAYRIENCLRSGLPY